MDTVRFCNEITSFCQANADESTVIKYSKYFKEGYDAYGVPSAVFMAKVDEFMALGKLDLPLILESAPQLLLSGKYEETSFIIVLTERFKKNFDSQTFEAIEKWFEYGITNWAHADTLCGTVLPWFFLKKIVPLERLNKWKISPYKFQRRCVPVAMIKLLKSTNDFNPLFEMTNPIMLDNERVVHQGLGWFLREAWKFKHKETEDFLMKWKDNAARLIFQYATEKMHPDERIKFKKKKP
ncbi:MAG: DNA alkylation repair protein [Mariniphaga sp.]